MQTEGNIFEEDDSDSELLKWRNEGHFYDFRGNQIFIIELGNRSKPPVVFLHGFPTSSFDYKKVWNMLSDEYRLISFDLLGFGFSDKPRKKKYSILEQADIVEEVLSSLGITSSFLVAHDYGSIVAQELLHRTLSSVNGFKWKGVVFLNGALFPYLHRATFSQRLMASPFSGLFLPFFGFDKFKASLNSILGSRTKLDDLELQKYWILYKRKKGIKNTRALLQYIKERKLYGERWVEATINFSHEIFIIGVDDPVSGKHVLDEYQRRCPQAPFCALPEIGHYPQLEAPEKVADVIQAFLSSGE